MKPEHDIPAFYIYAASAAIFFFLIAAFFLMTSRAPEQELWEMPVSVEDAEKAYAYKPDPNSALIRFTPGIESWYVNSNVGFSFRLPDGFTAPDGTLKDSGAEVVQVSNGKGHTLDIVAVNSEIAAQELSESSIRAELVGETLVRFAERALPDGTKAIVYEVETEDNKKMLLGARFIKDGYLFTLRTSSESAELVDAVIGTWRFGLPVPPPPADAR